MAVAASRTAIWAGVSPGRAEDEAAPEPSAASASPSAVFLATALGFIIAAQAIVPAANLASFLVGPDPKKIFGSTYKFNFRISIRIGIVVMFSKIVCN